MPRRFSPSSPRSISLTCQYCNANNTVYIDRHLLPPYQVAFVCRLCCRLQHAVFRDLETHNAPMAEQKKYHCVDCHKAVKRKKLCGRCSVCPACCECSKYCNECNKQHSRVWKLCPVCGACTLACRCRKRPKFLTHLHATESKTPRVINPLSRSLSLEVEIAGLNEYRDIVGNLPPTYKHWWNTHVSMVRDSSVSSGLELVVAPQSGDKFVSSTAIVSSVLQQSGVTFDSTCGFHVHANASDFSSLAIKNILWLWKTYHSTMKGHLFAESRIDNNFCKETTVWLQDIFPLIENTNDPRVLRAVFTWVRAVGLAYFGSMTNSAVAKDHQSLGALNFGGIRNLLPGTSTSNPRDLLVDGVSYIVKKQKTSVKNLVLPRGLSLLRQHYNPIRYSSLNLASLWYRGSLEFRVKEGTCAFDELLFWPLFCGQLVEIAATQDFSEIRIATAELTLSEFVEYKTKMGRRWFSPAIESWVKTKLDTKC